MKMKKNPSTVFTKWVLIGAIAVAFISVLYIFLLLNGTYYSNSVVKTPKANLTVVASGAIPTVDMNFLIITPTPTIDPGQTINGISVQKYVKIEGTGGVGLRIRNNPGTNSDTEFIANESEVFIVIGGPQNADDLVWWQLVTPYDDSRQGWAAADYLTPIENQ